MRRMSPTKVAQPTAARPIAPQRTRGFTLVELLIVVSILLILTTLVVIMFNNNYNSERVRGSARQIQSVMLGAQSRTVLRKIPTGLRLTTDRNDPTVSTGFVYIGATKNHRGVLQIARIDANYDQSADNAEPQPYWWLVNQQVANLYGNPTQEWYKLYQQGLLVDGSRIRIPANGNWYTVRINASLIAKDILILATDYKTAPIYSNPSVPAHDPMDYILELQPTLLPDEKPVTFASGMVIDLFNSRIPGAKGATALGTDEDPAGWYHQVSVSAAGAVPAGYYDEGPDPSNAAMKICRKYSPRMDILFSPRGEVSGPLAAHGILHLLLADTRDTDLKYPPEAGQFDCVAVSLFTRTGSVITSPVDKITPLGADGLAGVAGTDDDGNGVTDYDKNGIADPFEVGYGGSDDNLTQRFRYAEIGSSAGK